MPDTEGKVRVFRLLEFDQTEAKPKLLRASYRGYDDSNRLKYQLLPDGRLDTFDYDRAGRLIEHTDGEGIMHLMRRNASTGAQATLAVTPDGFVRASIDAADTARRDIAAASTVPQTLSDDFGRVCKSI